MQPLPSEQLFRYRGRLNEAGVGAGQQPHYLMWFRYYWDSCIRNRRGLLEQVHIDPFFVPPLLIDPSCRFVCRSGRTASVQRKVWQDNPTTRGRPRKHETENRITDYWLTESYTALLLDYSATQLSCQKTFHSCTFA